MRDAVLRFGLRLTPLDAGLPESSLLTITRLAQNGGARQVHWLGMG
ncbi:MAG: hypothetical protein ACRECZ_01580 [Methylocella sp.]